MSSTTNAKNEGTGHIFCHKIYHTIMYVSGQCLFTDTLKIYNNYILYCMFLYIYMYYSHVSEYWVDTGSNFRTAANVIIFRFLKTNSYYKFFKVLK